jgi:predicted nucleic acid-binding protein
MPASGRLLLDTNIVIALLEGDEAVLSNLDEAAEIFISAIVLGELFFGAAKSGRPSDLLNAWGTFRAFNSPARVPTPLQLYLSMY